MKQERGVELIQHKLTAWWQYLMTMLPNLALALLVMLCVYVLAKFIRLLSASFILQVSRSPSIAGLVSGLLYASVMITGLMTALDIMELDKTVSSLLAGVGIIGLALGFAFQDLTANFISGAFIALKRPFDVGHTVETNGFLGIIEDIQLRSTTLRTSAGLHVIIPNKDIFQRPIINYSRTAERRVELDFTVPNTIALRFLEKIIREHLSQQDGVRKLEFYYTAIDTPNIKVNVSFWTHNTSPRAYMKTRHLAILTLDETFARHDIYHITVPAEADVQKG